MDRLRARLIGAVVTSALVYGCANEPGPAAPGKTPPPAVPPAALIEIPRATENPVFPPSHLRGVGNPAKGDLDEILARGMLRVLVAPGRTHFQIFKGFQRGRTYDVSQALRKQLMLRPETSKLPIVLLETPEDSLIRDLLAGKGDIAANVRLTFERDDVVAFAAPIRKGIRELVVTGPGGKPLVSLEDIGGRAIHVRASSDHHASLVRLNEQLTRINRPPARIVIAPPAATDEDLLEQVNAGTIPATITDDYIFDVWRKTLDKIAANPDVAVSQDGVIAWVTRKDAPKLLALLNEFFSTHKLTF